MKFQVGDRVRCIGGLWYDDVEGIEGTVVTFRKYPSSENLGIKFDRRPKYGGHSLDDFLKGKYDTYGYWIDAEDLELTKKTNIGRY